MGVRCKAQLLSQQEPFPTCHGPPGSSVSQWHSCTGYMPTAGERASEHSPCLQFSCCPLSQASHVTSPISPLCSCQQGGRRRSRAWFRQQCDAPSSGGIPSPALPSCLHALTRGISQIWKLLFLHVYVTSPYRNIFNTYTLDI